MVFKKDLTFPKQNCFLNLNHNVFMRYIKLFLFFTLLTTTQTFAADDIETLKAEMKQLKSANEKKEVDALKQEILDLKIKRLEDKIDSSEKRLDDKIQTKSERLDDKVESKFDMASFLGRKDKSESEPQIASIAKQKPRYWSLSIASTGSTLHSAYNSNYYYYSSSLNDTLYMRGLSAGISYTRNRFFGEIIGTSISGKTEGYANYYSYPYYPYSWQTTEASIKSVDLRLGYQLGGDVFKFEPYVGIGKASMTVNDVSTSFTQFAPGAKLSLGSSQVRAFLDVTVPSDISSKKAEQVKLNAIARFGLSFAF